MRIIDRTVWDSLGPFRTEVLLFSTPGSSNGFWRRNYHARARDAREHSNCNHLSFDITA
jgi:hypothetical protein